MTNSQKIELQFRRKFGLVVKIDGECAVDKLPVDAAVRTIKDIEKFLSKTDDLVETTFLNVAVRRKNALLGKLSKKSPSAKRIKIQDRLRIILLENQIKKKLSQNVNTQPYGQLMAQAVLDELEDLEFGQYRGPIELFENHFKQLEPSSNLDEFAMSIANAIFDLVKHREDVMLKKMHCSQSESTPLH